MQNAEMINETPEIIPIHEEADEPSESIEMTAEMAMLISKTVEHAIERTKKDLIKHLTTKPAKVPVPVDDNVPGVDTVTLNPQEWAYFVEEIKTKNVYSAFNNAKYLFMLDKAFADKRSVTFTSEEWEKFVNAQGI